MNFDGSIALLVSIQNLGTWLEAPMRFFTFLGTENFYLLIMPILYWCVDASLGLRVGVILLLSGGINSVLKMVFHSPRPYWVSAQLKALSSETTFGVPSGHAQNAVGVWGIMASYIAKPWAWACAIALIFLIGFSRLFLGVHFVGDVVIGWLIGAALLFIVLKLWDKTGSWLLAKSLAQQIFFFFIFSMTILLAGAISFYGLRDFSIPDEWMTNAAHAGTDLPAPVSMNGIITSAATLFGLAAGAAWIRQMGGFQASGPFEKRVLRYIVGILGVAIFWFGLGAVFPHGEALLPYILRYVRYALTGAWLTGGAPWLFFRFNLARSPNR